jgi:hypothetical protein
LQSLPHVVNTLRKARDEARSEFERLDQALTALGGAHSKPGKHRLSKEAREKIAKAQRDRWAKVHAQSGSVKNKIGPKGKTKGRAWSDMTATERSAEMIRRRKVAEMNKKRK